MKYAGLCFLLFLLSAANLLGQQSLDLTFHGHALGETAEAFFSSATMAESKAGTKEYCASLLNDSQKTDKYKSFKHSLGNQSVTVLNKQDFVVFDVDGCKHVEAALAGENTNVGARFASELGKGGALFASGKLVGFNLISSASYSEEIASMEKRFGFQGQKYNVARPGWPDLQEMRWEADGVIASIFETHFADNNVTILIGYLQPPYASFLRGTPAPEPSSSTERESPTCKPVPPASTTRKQVSPGVMQGLAFHKVAPKYSESAKQNHIEGAVVLSIVLDTCGHVSAVEPVSGPAELIPAAVSAVQQWQYRPYLLAGEPVEVSTRVTFNFQLSH